MLRLSRAQRMLLTETLLDIANIAAGAMVVPGIAGVLVLDRSLRDGCVGRAGGFRDRTRRGNAAMTQNMWNVVIILGGITLFAATITLLDWLGRRKDRQERNRAA